jgi:hypothetical protein
LQPRERHVSGRGCVTLPRRSELNRVPSKAYIRRERVSISVQLTRFVACANTRFSE